MAKKYTQEDLGVKDLYGGWRESAESFGKVLDQTNDKIKAQADAIDKLRQANTKGQKGIDAELTSRRELEKLVKKSIETDKAKLQLAKQKQQVSEKLRQTKAGERDGIIRMQAELAKETAERRKNAKESMTQLNAYEKLQKVTKKAREETKRLAAQYGINDKRTVISRKRYEQLDTRLQHLNRTASNGRASFTQLANGMQKAQGAAGRMLTQLGLGVGVFQLLRTGASTIADFDSSIASLGSITGKSGAELDKFKNKVLEVSENTGKSATEISEAMKLVGSAQPELLKSADSLAAVTEQAVILAQAGGLDVPRAAESLTNAMNQFGVGADQAAKFVDILATSQQKGTAPIDKMSDALVKSGGTAKAFGLSFEETNAYLQAFAKGGVLGSEAGTQFSGILSKLAKTSKDEFNPSIVGGKQALDNLLEANLSYTELLKLTDAEGAKWITTLQNQKGVVKELTGNLNEQGNALKQAKQNTDTVSGSLEKATTAIQNYILGSEGATTVSETLKWALKGIAENLPTIVSWGFRLIKMYAIWRVSQSKVVRQLGEMAKGLKASRFNVMELYRSMKDGKKGFEGATTSAKNFGKAIKSISFAVAIELALELAMGLWQIYEASTAAYKAEQLRAELTEKIAKAEENAARTSNNLLDEWKKKTFEGIEATKRKLDLDLAEGRIKNQEEYNKLLQEEIDIAMEGVKQEVEQQIVRQKLRVSHGRANKENIKQVSDFRKLEQQQYEVVLKLKNQLANADYLEADAIAAKLKNEQEYYVNISERADIVDQLIAGGKEIRDELRVMTEETNIQTAQLKTEKKLSRERREDHLSEIDLLKEINELHKERLSLEQDREIADIDAQIKNLNRLIEKETELQMAKAGTYEGFDSSEIERLEDERLRLRIMKIEDAAEYEINVLRDSLLIQSEERRKALNDEYLDKIASADNDEELQQELDRELNKLDAIDLAEKEKVEKEISNIRAAAARERADLEIETAQEILDVTKDLIDNMLSLDDLYATESKLKRLELLEDTTKTSEQIEEEYSAFLIEQLEERIQAEKDYMESLTEAQITERQEAGEKILDLELQLAEMRQKLLEDERNKEKEAREELYEYLGELADKSFEEAKKMSQERQKLLEDEITAQEAVINAQKEAAAQGNATAAQSLKVEEDILEEKKAALADEQKREEIVQQLETFYNLVNQFISTGDNAAVATGKAAAQTLSVKEAGEALFNLAGGFYEGTDWKLGQEHTPFKSGKDGHLIRVDSNEGIVNPSLMNMAEGAGISSINELVNKAVMYQQLSGGYAIMNNPVPSPQNDANSIMLYQELKNIQRTIENNPAIIFKDESSKAGLANAINMGIKRGNKTEWYRKINRS